MPCYSSSGIRYKPLKSHSFLEEDTTGCLALTLVRSCLRLVHLSCFSMVQNLAEENSISVSVAFHVSPTYVVLPAHLSQLVCITSLTPLDLTLPTIASIGCKIFDALFRGMIFMLQGKMALSHLGAFIKPFRNST